MSDTHYATNAAAARPSKICRHALAVICALSVGATFVPAAEKSEAAHAASPAAHGPAAAAKFTPDQALERLLQGNQRFVASQATHPNQTTERRQSLVQGQAPMAIVLTCSDSRVAPELFLDQGLGDLFVIRNAGNILDDHVIGSMEYAVEHLHVGLIMVIGHEKCGAVAAAVGGGEIPGHIHSVTDCLAPAVEAAKSQPGDKVDNTVRANAKQVAQILTHVEPFLKAAQAEGKLKIVAARYELGSGQIELLK